MEHDPAITGNDWGRLCGREHILPMRIYYEDTDFSGVVYHANYVRYLERGRSEFIRAIGASHTSLLQGPSPATFMVSGLSMRFIRPARIDDRLEVRTLCEYVRGARLICRQAVFRGTELIIEAEVENVCVTLEGRPRRIPPTMMEKLRPHLMPPAAVVAAETPARQLAYSIAAE